MIHRYIAGSLGLLVLGMAAMTFMKRLPRRKLAGALVLLVGLQVPLGMWTVTLQLMPLVVAGHLLGGFTLFSLLWIWFLSQHQFNVRHDTPSLAKMLPYTGLALVALLLQIF